MFRARCAIRGSSCIVQRARISKNNGRALQPCGTRLAPCRVTNTQQEVWKDAGIEDPETDRGEWVQQIQIPQPELGPLQKRVTRSVQEELAAEGFNPEDTGYWFTEPKGGWNTERVFEEYAEVTESEFADARHYGPDRWAIEDLEEGEELEGEVTDVWLYHGAEVDIGAQFDGLIPISEEQWEDPEVQEMLMPGAQLVVQIHKIRYPATLYRWPIQLKIVEPEGLQEKLTNPDAWTSPVDHRGWEPEVIQELTGRKYVRRSYFMDLPVEDAAKRAHMAIAAADPIVQEQAALGDDFTTSYFSNPDAQAVMSDVIAEVM